MDASPRFPGVQEKVQRHVIDNLPPQQNRKRNICLQTLQTIREGSNDVDLTERAKSYLTTLLRFGLDDFEDSVKHVVRTSGCACSKFPVNERKPYKDYDLGTDHCSKAEGNCGIAAFLTENKELASRILAHLQALDTSRMTEELKRAKHFLESFIVRPEDARKADPCLKVGDLIIAMERANFPDFYTFNLRESLHLCRATNQNMVVRPKYHIHDDVYCGREQADWETYVEERRSKGAGFDEI